MGHLLKRETRTDRDSRVDHFIPDTWQVLYIFFIAYKYENLSKQIVEEKNRWLSSVKKSNENA